MYRVYDLHAWKRKEMYEFFRTYDDPFFGICTSLEVGALHAFCKASGHSFHLAALYHSLRAANASEAFRLRIRGEDVLLFDEIHCGTTVLHEDDTFSFCYIPMAPSLAEFERLGRDAIERQHRSRAVDPNAGQLNLIYYSTLPWTVFTGLKHAKRLQREDSIPRITFGKYSLQQGQLRIPISLEVSHALMDGVHAGRYLEALQELLLHPGE